MTEGLPGLVPILCSCLAVMTGCFIYTTRSHYVLNSKIQTLNAQIEDLQKIDVALFESLKKLWPKVEELQQRVDFFELGLAQQPGAAVAFSETLNSTVPAFLPII